MDSNWSHAPSADETPHEREKREAAMVLNQNHSRFYLSHQACDVFSALAATSAITRRRTYSLMLICWRAAVTLAAFTVSFGQRMLTIWGFSRVLGRPTLPLRTFTRILPSTILEPFIFRPFSEPAAFAAIILYVYTIHSRLRSRNPTRRGIARTRVFTVCSTCLQNRQ